MSFCKHACQHSHCSYRFLGTSARSIAPPFLILLASSFHGSAVERTAKKAPPSGGRATKSCIARRNPATRLLVNEATRQRGRDNEADNEAEAPMFTQFDRLYTNSFKARSKDFTRLCISKLDKIIFAESRVAGQAELPRMCSTFLNASTNPSLSSS